MKNFDKTYTQSDLDDILATNTEENLNLEFKGAESLKKTDGAKNEISKDVSSFANADGGIIVYGISEKDHIADSYDFIDGNDFTKEQLEQIIHSRIHRNIEGVIIEPIRIDEDFRKTIYVVKIPASSKAPHMAHNHKYYRRHSFNILEMEEYEVRSMYSRPAATSLKIVEPKIRWNPSQQMGKKLVSIMVNWDMEVLNDGSTIEKDYKLQIIIPRLAAIGIQNELFNKELSEHKSLEKDGFWHYSVPNKSPLFQNEHISILSARFQINKNGYNSLIEHNVIVKLYYSSGVQEMSFSFIDALNANGNELALEDFR